MSFLKDWGALSAVLIAIVGGVYKFASLENQVKNIDPVAIVSMVKDAKATIQVGKKEIEEALERSQKRKTSNSIQFGEFETIPLNKTIHANSDGIIVALISGKATSGGIARIDGFTGKGLDPSDLRASASIAGHRNSIWEKGQRNTMTMPIKTGEYYKIKSGGTMKEAQYHVSIMWIPFN